MQHTLTIPPLGPADLDSSPVFNVVIAYEDFETGKQAKKTYDFLAQNLGSDCHFTNQMWKFDVLGIPNLREIAVKDAAMADIIIISCHSHDLPAHVKNWLESWLTQPLNALALVALVGDANVRPQPHSAAKDYIAAIARRARIEFFAHPCEWLGTIRKEEVPFQRSVDFGEQSLPPFASMVQPDVTMPRWGINE